MDWFYVADKRQVGPVSETEFARLVGLGAIRGDTLVWHAGMKDWQPYISFFPPPPPPGTPSPPGGASGPAQPTPSSASTSGSPDGAAAPSGGGAGWTAAPAAAGAGVAAMGLMSPVRPVEVRRYGGFWIRFLARFVDWLIVAFVGSCVMKIFGIGSVWSLMNAHDSFDIASALALLGLGAFLSFVVGLAISATYEILLTWKKGATLGKLALGLRVVRPDGSAISGGQAVGRYFGTRLSKFIFFIGFILAAFDDEKRSLHDRLCETRVIRT
jgi:uncharacterized RDD family membrane protein YckC